MATLRDIRRRIASVKSTQQITKAMKMVAAAKLRRAQEQLVNSRPYAYRLNQMLAHVAAREDRGMHPLLEEREPRTVCYIVVAADRGLCGSFNANVLRKSKGEIDGHEAETTLKVVAVGRKSHEFYSRRGYPVVKSFTGFFNRMHYQHALDIARFVREMYEQRECDRVFVVYNQFKSAAVQRVAVEQLLPIEPEEPEVDKYLPAEYLFEPSVQQILNLLCPRNLDTQVWRVLLESYAAEQGARMVAMESATDNAQEMIHDLTLYYNKVRQSAITKEILEIVAGAEALKG
ncbi:MAG: ATP synthase F1 subunit gamma [Calditrichaeota bacterium]|nr:MAG: ATP synthase F1 subunit gamma [Calditrichota bacterium]